jgi:predicted metalloprotease with PDZ domain
MRDSRVDPRACFAACALLATAWPAHAQVNTPASSSSISIELAVDASGVHRRIVHSRMKIPVGAGALTLQYPKWIPGEHGPSGPVADLAGLRIEAGGKPLGWHRNPVDMFEFVVDVPAGVASVDVSFDFLSTPPSNQGFTSGASATSNLAVLSWNQLVLYPKGVPSAQVEVRTTLKLPEGWKFGTALPVVASSGSRIEFAPVSLVTLVDSPLNAGIHFRTVQLAPGEPGPRHYLHIAAESAAAAELDDATRASLDRLVVESGRLFGARHYPVYHFLLTLSDGIAHFGMEHHLSSDNRVDERTLIDDDLGAWNLSVLSHEMVHSWNGKYRRPLDLVTPDFQQPIRSDLLWVYEGLTQYLGFVLAARSGINTPEQSRGELAMVADWAAHRQGRMWRPLEDTATAAQLLFGARGDWEGWRRSVDFYDEGRLLWLEADATIRELTRGRKSLDDFVRAFHGGASGTAEVVPYTFDDIVAGLDAVAPYDWRQFLVKRVRLPVERSALATLKLGGWKLAYTGERSEMQELGETANEIQDLTASLGLQCGDDGLVKDVIVGSPADRAGVAPGVGIVAVNGFKFSGDRLRDALKAKAPVDLLVENAEFYRTLTVDYTAGERYPHLERDADKADALTAILTPLAPRQK